MKSGAITGDSCGIDRRRLRWFQLGNLLAPGKNSGRRHGYPRARTRPIGAGGRTIRANKMLDINPETIDELAKLI